VACRQGREVIALGDKEWVRAYEQSANMLLNNRFERSLNFPQIAHVQADQF